jgi:hypothetical protein
LHLYTAYGLGICSEICLPMLPVGTRKIDVEIKRAKLDGLFQSLINDEKCFRETESEVSIYRPNIGSILIRQGREIYVDPVPEPDEQLLCQYLMGTILGALLHQREMLVLHGSAIAVDGKAIAFLGPSGSGKSTSAAFLSEKGYSVVTDDVVAIDATGSKPMVYPSFPQIKLKADVALSLGYDLRTLPHANGLKRKHVVNEALGFLSEPIALRRIYILEKGECIEIQRLGQQESMIELVRNSYVLKYLNVKTHLQAHFSQSSKVARIIPICRLKRTFDLKLLNDFAHVIDEDVRCGYRFPDSSN